MRPKIFFGPNSAFLIGGKTKSDITLHGQTTSNESEAKDYMNGFDFGLEGEIGCNFRLSESGTWLNLDATFYLGLVDISNNTDQNSYNMHFSLNAGITNLNKIRHENRPDFSIV